MSLIKFTVDIQRDNMSATDGGGEVVSTTSTPYSGLLVTANYPDKSSVYRRETAMSRMQGPGPLTQSDRVVILEGWTGVEVIRVNDRVVPNPAKAELPTAMKVVGVRPYEDELQLDVQDVSTSTGLV